VVGPSARVSVNDVIQTWRLLVSSSLERQKRNKLLRSSLKINVKQSMHLTFIHWMKLDVGIAFRSNFKELNIAKRKSVDGSVGKRNMIWFMGTMRGGQINVSIKRCLEQCKTIVLAYFRYKLSSS
jgi:hypothetical protein